MDPRTDVSVGREPARLTLGHFLADVARAGGDREAIVQKDLRWSYRELEAEARALARGLVGAGVVKGARVGLLMPNRAEWIAAAFAAGMIGAVVVPVNTYATPEECDHILRHSDASLLLMQEGLLRHAWAEELAARHREIAAGPPGALRCEALPQLRRVFCLGRDAAKGGIEPWKDLLALGDGVSDALLDALTAEVVPSDPALIIYTSGSTALPKGVVHGHRAPVTQGWRFVEQMGLGPSDRVWTAQPFFWTAGFCMSLGATLGAGGTLLVQDHFDAGEALDILETERATMAHGWAHQQKAMGDHPSAAQRDLSSLEKVGFHSPLHRLAGRTENKWGPEGAYGLSETFTICSSIPSDSPLEQREGTHGKPLPGMSIRIVDPETGQEVPTGQEGEITVKGVNLMLGYHKVAPEQWRDAEGYFHTGDAGLMDAEGFLHWTGRSGDLIKTGGANVSPVEIEREVLKLDSLHAARVVGVPHPTLGEIVVLCAVAAEGHPEEEEPIRTYLKQHLASYKVPRRVLFFEQHELELTGNQKIRIAPLREAAGTRLATEHAEIAGHVYGA